MKGKCVLCEKDKILFTIDYNGGRADACSICITTNHLTGWSK